MSVFDAYARYYDLLYRDKDYAGEAKFVASLLRRARPQTVSVLDLGCGTGRHAEQLARLGLDVTGVEMSTRMLAGAQALRESLPPELAGRLHFAEGDARSFRAGRTYDAVTALFHVLSYQTDNSSVRFFLSTAADHLEPGGLFLFDCWYGPAVLTERPEQRSKSMSDDALEILRHATPRLHVDRNVVDVHYDVEIRERSTGAVQKLAETHHMRYFFAPELEWYLADAGFEPLWSGEFMTERPLDDRAWNALFLARKKHA
jgi:SAM-dependent methyltransferase